MFVFEAPTLAEIVAGAAAAGDSGDGLDAMTVDELADARQDAEASAKAAAAAIDRIDMELVGRLAELYPDWSATTTDHNMCRLDGDNAYLYATWRTIYEFNEIGFEATVKPLLTKEERRGLFMVRNPSVNHDYFNMLLERGGDFARQLEAVRWHEESELRFIFGRRDGATGTTHAPKARAEARVREDLGEG